MSKNRILVIEDDKDIADSIGLNLELSGYDYTIIDDGLEAAKRLSEDHSFDLALLDVMLPGLDGFALMEHMQKYNIPVIYLTAKADVPSRIKGLKIGAEDYIVKPFSARELIARIKAVLRRISAEPEAEGKTIRLDDLEISLNNYEVKIKGKPVDFTPKEVEILYLLASHPGRVFDREQILSKIWGYDYFGDTRAVDTQIERIRQKIPDEGLSWGIRTVYGVGYKFGASDA